MPLLPAITLSEIEQAISGLHLYVHGFSMGYGLAASTHPTR